MSAKGKVKRKLTFDLDIPLEKELYDLLSEHAGAGVEVLVEHYEGFKKKSKVVAKKDKIGDSLNAYNEIESYIGDLDNLLEKIEELKDNKEDLVLHLVEDEILNHQEYQKRVWRPHFELNADKREEISTKLYGSDSPEIKRRASLEQARRYKTNGVRRTQDEQREQSRHREKNSILDTFLINKEG